MIDRIRTWAAIIGMTMIGPIFLGFYVVCLLKGEFPFRHSTLRAAEDPVFFTCLSCRFSMQVSRSPRSALCSQSDTFVDDRDISSYVAANPLFLR